MLFLDFYVYDRTGIFFHTNTSHYHCTSLAFFFQELLRDYHVDADVAFFLHRPVLAQKIAAKCEYLRKSSEIKSSNLEKTMEIYTTAAKDSLEPILHGITPLLPSRVWEDISPEFYVTFW